MKKVFLVVVLLGFLFSNAQQKNLSYPQKPKKEFQSYQPWNKSQTDLQQEWNNRLRNFRALSIYKPKLLYILKDSTKVFALPQDNMICLVPDMKQFNMPNAASTSSFFELQKQAGKIPNAAIPLILPKE